MTRDFTLCVYQQMIQEFESQGYHFINFVNYLANPNISEKIVIMRHDAERMINNVRSMALLENKLKISASYYFRYPNTFDYNIVKEIYNLGHEIGYHYETLVKENGDYERAIALFEKEIEEFRKISPIKTITAHGSPLSRYDNKQLWKKYDFKSFGIIGEPYFSLNFNEFLYLTDTGRTWNSKAANIRDKVFTQFNYNFRTTFEVIRAIKKNEIPARVMLNVHPHRWNDNFFAWGAELIGQNIKNLIKNIILNHG
jgi:hypothetical protein